MQFVISALCSYSLLSFLFFSKQHHNGFLHFTSKYVDDVSI